MFYVCCVHVCVRVCMCVPLAATPSFAVEPLIRVAINVSQTLRLSCAVTGKPLPKVSWRRNGVAMDMNAQLLGTSRLQFLEEEVKLKSGAIAVQSELIVNNSASDVMGSYSCYAKNSLGETRSQATRVEVQGEFGCLLSVVCLLFVCCLVVSCLLFVRCFLFFVLFFRLSVCCLKSSFSPWPMAN